jgi:hypothetical protein
MQKRNAGCGAETGVARVDPMQNAEEECGMLGGEMRCE